MDSHGERLQKVRYLVPSLPSGKTVFDKRSGAFLTIATQASDRPDQFRTHQTGDRWIPEDNLVPLQDLPGAFLRTMFPSFTKRRTRTLH